MKVWNKDKHKLNILKNTVVDTWHFLSNMYITPKIIQHLDIQVGKLLNMKVTWSCGMDHGIMPSFHFTKPIKKVNKLIATYFTYTTSKVNKLNGSRT